MNVPIRTINLQDFSSLLSEIPDAPKELFVRGNLPSPDSKCLAVVGSRNYTNYGKQVVEYLIGGLRGYPVSIISGLALGIDALAHKSALDAHLYTLAVPGSGLDDRVLYPRQNAKLAERILTAGGGLLSEYEPLFTATKWSFPRRNRIMAGLSHAILLIEAGEKSGTLITARLTAEYNRELLVVPGSIFSENSYGTHQFLKLGATPVTNPADILDAMGIVIEEKTSPSNILSFTENEQSIMHILSEPRDHDTIIRSLHLPREITLTLLMKLELDGHIKEQGGIFYKVT